MGSRRNETKRKTNYSNILFSKAIISFAINQKKDIDMEKWQKYNDPISDMSAVMSRSEFDSKSINVCGRLKTEYSTL